MHRFFSLSFLLRLWRVGVLIAIVWFIHQQHEWFSAQKNANLTPDRVRDFFPEAVSLGPLDPQSGIQKVLNEFGDTLGLITQTAPLSDKIIGYSGPTNCLIAMNPQARVIGIRILHSADTPDHIATILKQRAFFHHFHDLKFGNVDSQPKKIDLVSGATLTSDAISQGIMKRLGGAAPSLRFPEALTVQEVRSLVPEADLLQPMPSRPGMMQVLNAQGQVIAHVTRSAPEGDTIIGYKGPSDTLIALDATGQTITGFKLRKSYDNEDYIAYVTGDRFFSRSFDQLTLEQMAHLDFQAAGIAGATGATETSWAIAEGIKRRSAALLTSSPSQSNPSFQIRLPQLRAADWGLLAVIVLSLLMSFTSLRSKRWAKNLHQLALIGYAGAFSGAMISQGLFIGWSRHGIPWQSAPMLVLLAALALALPMFTRRQFYCHHYCPHGALQNWLSRRLKRHWKVPQRLAKLLEKLPSLLLVVIFLMVMLGLNVDINQFEAFDAWLITVASLSIILMAAIGLIFSLFTPMAYCRYGCPTGALLKFVRHAGPSDRFGSKDLFALILLFLAIILHWQRETLLHLIV